VPARRAGAGSAMNDASRELGAALGVAVLGSVAASHYANGVGHLVGHLPGGQQSAAESSLAGALDVASHLPAAAGQALTTGAQDVFVGGIHMAVTVGAILAVVAAAIVMKFLPRNVGDEGAMHGPIEAMEEAAELGLAGTPPIFADDPSREAPDETVPVDSGAGR
jgi:MFS transporter, DHA2 family, multidrug resistance protein